MVNKDSMIGELRNAITSGTFDDRLAAVRYLVEKDRFEAFRLLVETAASENQFKTVRERAVDEICDLFRKCQNPEKLKNMSRLVEELPHNSVLARVKDASKIKMKVMGLDEIQLTERDLILVEPGDTVKAPAKPPPLPARGVVVPLRPIRPEPPQKPKTPFPGKKQAA